jgi:hypothetical protein
MWKNPVFIGVVVCCANNEYFRHRRQAFDEANLPHIRQPTFALYFGTEFSPLSSHQSNWKFSVQIGILESVGKK